MDSVEPVVPVVPEEAAALPYTEEQRRIYRYEVNGEARLADPIALTRRIAKAQRALKVDLGMSQREVAKLQSAIADGAELPGELMDLYYDELANIARVADEAFGVPNVEQDEAGWTESEALEALSGFYEWLSGVREDFTSTPSPADSTTSVSTGSEPEAAACPTEPSSGSGPTDPES